MSLSSIISIFNSFEIQSIQQSSFEVYEVLQDDDFETKVWIYPHITINGLFLPLYQGLRCLYDISDFAKLENIDIIKSEDESKFFINLEVRKKLTWESFLFNYHKSVCFIIQENYSKRNNQYITKNTGVPSSSRI